MNTVVHKELHNLWGGKVIVDEIRQFADDRGMLCEIWRVDDDKEKSVPPLMSYWSVTNPFVMRGPHEHTAQCDWFVTWFSRMVYQLYNPHTGEMFHFITEPNKVYRVKVDVGIIHSYRNLELRPATTGNFPSALFMGQDKKSPIDEIRHEEKLKKDLTTYVVLGAGGRLGKAIVDYLYKNIGCHSYHVIPVFEKMKDVDDVETFFDVLLAAKPELDIKNVKIINCAALTDVQKLQEYSSDVKWVNVDMPYNIASRCALAGCQFIQISSDYVYREGDQSVYTRSKKDMEHSLRIFSPSARIVRVANLFSMDPLDTHNILSKLKEAVKAGKAITYDPDQKVYPTDVARAAWAIINFIDLNEAKECSVHGNEMTVAEICTKLGCTNLVTKKSGIEYNHSAFLKGAWSLDCSDSINKKLE
jgi:dTDP-4-dehydrorhamnose 3,5-epimerase